MVICDVLLIPYTSLRIVTTGQRFEHGTSWK